jgi:acetyl esterase/lipase
MHLDTAKEDNATTILHFHGGGLVSGSADVYKGALAPLAQRVPADVLIPRYRLAPEFTVPEIVNDAVNANKWLSKEKNASDIILWGDSAGGALAMLLLQELIQDKAQLPRAVILVSPVTDMTYASYEPSETDPVSNAGVLKFLQKQFQNTPHSILSMSADTLSALPPVYIAAGKSEWGYTGISQLHSMLQSAGVNATLEAAENMPHVFSLFYDWIPEGQGSVSKIVDFMKSLNK